MRQAETTCKLHLDLGREYFRYIAYFYFDVTELSIHTLAANENGKLWFLVGCNWDIRIDLEPCL